MHLYEIAPRGDFVFIYVLLNRPIRGALPRTASIFTWHLMSTSKPHRIGMLYFVEYSKPPAALAAGGSWFMPSSSPTEASTVKTRLGEKSAEAKGVISRYRIHAPEEAKVRYTPLIL